MARAGYLGSNVSRNMQIPHGVRIMFKRTGAGTNWIDMGDVSDLSVTPLAEFLEHFSNQDGRNALAKRILTNRGVSIEATLNEINAENLKLAFLGGNTSNTASTVKVTTSEVVMATSASGTPIWLLSDAPAGSDATSRAASVLRVASEDGDTEYTGYVVGGASAPFYISNDPGHASDDLDPLTVGTKLHITYETELSTTGTTFTILDDTSVEGRLQFQIRNMEGGLAQILELDSVTIAPSGAITVPVDAVQQLPLTITAQIVNGEFGRMHLVDV
jgi:hypothetical protein